MSNNKVLILAAIPDGLRLDKEIRQIEDAIRRAVKRDLFEIKIRTAVRPLNVGLAIELPEFNLSQVEKMAQLYEVDIQLGEQGIIKLMTLLGGHPYLMQEAFANLKNQEMSLEKLLTLAPTEEGIFSHHLREQLKCLQDDSQLESAYKEVAIALESVQLNPEIMFKLHSLGLIKIIRNACVPSCDLYRQYFSARMEQ